MADFFKFSGRVEKVLDTETIPTKKGDLIKRSILVKETKQEYPSTVLFTFLNNNVSKLDGVNKGDIVDVLFGIETREYNDKYYTEAKAFGIKVAEF